MTPLSNFSVLVYRSILALTKRRGLFTLARINAKLFSSGQTVVLPGGATMFIPGDPHFFGFILGTHESHIADLLVKSVREGDTCLDVGANIGYFSCILAQLVGASGEVVAFEPVPENYAVLQQNAALASARGLHIRAVQAAVSSQAGELKIVRQQWSTYHQVAAIESGATSVERIPAIALDTAIDELPGDRCISMLKVDVEGHELPVVMGMQRSLAARRIRRLVIEVTPGADAVEIERILKGHARRIQVWSGHRWIEQPLGSMANRTDVFVEF